jgi:hypothetical protein
MWDENYNQQLSDPNLDNIMEGHDSEQKKSLCTVEGAEIPFDKLQAMKDYAKELRRRFPQMKPKRLERKVAEHFKIKLVK